MDKNEAEILREALIGIAITAATLITVKLIGVML